MRRPSWKGVYDGRLWASTSARAVRIAIARSRCPSTASSGTRDLRKSSYSSRASIGRPSPNRTSFATTDSAPSSSGQKNTLASIENNMVEWPGCCSPWSRASFRRGSPRARSSRSRTAARSSSRAPALERADGVVGDWAWLLRTHGQPRMRYIPGAGCLGDAPVRMASPSLPHPQGCVP